MPQEVKLQDHIAGPAERDFLLWLTQAVSIDQMPQTLQRFLNCRDELTAELRAAALEILPFVGCPEEGCDCAGYHLWRALGFPAYEEQGKERHAKVIAELRAEVAGVYQHLAELRQQIADNDLAFEHSSEVVRKQEDTIDEMRQANEMLTKACDLENENVGLLRAEVERLTKASKSLIHDLNAAGATISERDDEVIRLTKQRDRLVEAFQHSLVNGLYIDPECPRCDAIREVLAEADAGWLVAPAQGTT